MRDTIDIAKKLVSKQPVDSWEIYITSSESFRAEVKESTVDSFQRSNLQGMSVRVIKGHRPGFSFCSSSDPQNIEKTIIKAVDMAGVMPEDDSLGFTPGRKGSSEHRQLLDEKLLGMPEKEKIEIARIIEKEAYDFDKRIKVARTSGYVDSITRVRLINSLGLDVQDEAGMSTAWVELMAEDAQEQETSYWFDQVRNPYMLQPSMIARKAAGRAIRALGGKTVKSEKLPVIFENTTASGLLGVISSSFVAENHFKKTASPKVLQGAELFSVKLDIIDDGTDERGELAFGFDGEGIETCKTVLVDGGVVKSWLYDRYYGAKFGQPSTGNSRRGGFETPPTSGITNFSIRPGTVSLEEMLKLMGNGLLVTEMMGLHTANPVSGDFSVGASGFKVSNGLIDHPVKGIAIAGNLIDLFGKIAEIGSDFEFFGNIGACSVLCESIAVSGS